jgi:hypothetical protein
VLGHVLGESEMLDSLHIAHSFAKTRCPWFLSPSNKTLATVPFPSGMVGRFPEAPISCSTRKAGLSDGSRPYRNNLWAALVDEPMAQLHGCATPILKLLGPE